MDELLKAMQSQKILLIMDGFERALRAYSSMNAAYQGDEEPKLEDNQLDCVDVNAELFLKSICSLPNIKGKVLITTRLTPRCVKSHDELLQGCFEKELKEMDKADAMAFFQAQGIQGNRNEIEAVCESYGYHPLSLRLLAGRILRDFDNPADIVVAQKFKIDGDLRQHQHHVLEVSYNSLPPHEQKLLSTIACFRSQVELKTLEAINARATGQLPLQDDLHDLVERGLLHFDDKNKKFDLHPIVRRYAYDHFTDEKQRKEAHVELAMYFIDAMPVTNKNVKTLEDLAPVIELEYHMVRAENYEQAYQLLVNRLIPHPLHFQFGAYQLMIELVWLFFPADKIGPPFLKDENKQAVLYNSLANSYSINGQPRSSIPFYEKSIEISQKKEKELEQAVILGTFAYMVLIPTGDLHAAKAKLLSAIDLCKKIHNIEWEACFNLYLSSYLIIVGVWDEALKKLDWSQEIFDKAGARRTNFVSMVRAKRSQLALQMSRSPLNFQIEYRISSLDYAKQALTLAEAVAQSATPVASDFISSHWLLGASYRLDAQLDFAETHLSEALSRDRAINMVDHEADILLDFARLRYDQKNYGEAKSLAKEALSITERCGYVLQGADVNLFLAQYALEQEKDKVKAKEYAEQAKKLATCDGPPYYYKVAYEEAERLLEKLKE